MKKHLEKFLNMTLALSLIVHIFAPLTVLAAKVDIVLTFTVEDGANIVMQKGEHSLGGKLSSAADYSWFGFKQHNSNTDIPSSDVVTACTDATHCTATISIEGGQGFDLQIGGDAGFEFNGNINNILQSDTLTLRLKGTGGGQEQPPQNNEPVSTVDYDVTIKLTDNMKKYYELTAGTNVITVILKNSDPAVTSSIELKKHQQSENDGLTPIVTCNTAKDSCTMVAPANTETRLVFNTQHIDLAVEEPDEFSNTGFRLEGYRPENPIRNAKTFVVDEPRDFDNKAVLLWDCDGMICYNHSLFENVEQLQTGKFIAASDISNENATAGANTIKFDVHSREKFFAPYWKFVALRSQIDAAGAKIDSFKGQSGIDFAPVNEPQENNAYVSYGNRNFKIIIYGADYKGLTLGSLSDLGYYPREWANRFERRENYDISGTTKDKPVEMLGVLLQQTVKIQKITDNDYTIEKIEPIDVSNGAVEVTDNHDGTFDIEFKSNYFDKVEFKVTDDQGKEYFFLFNRRTIDPYFDIRHDSDEAKIMAEVYYHNETSYSNYNVLGKIQYKDGSTKVIELTAINYGRDGLNNEVNGIEYDEETPSYKDPNINIPVSDRGKGIKRAKFAYDIDKSELKKIDKVYINVERSGSTKDYYEGNFAGSGKGDVLDMKFWEDRL